MTILLEVLAADLIPHAAALTASALVAADPATIAAMSAITDGAVLRY